MKISVGEKIFNRFNYILLALIAFIALYPVIYVLSASISSADAVSTGKVLLFPKDITWVAYKNVFQEKGIWLGYANTIFYTLVGTGVNLFITICGAYPLSKRELPGRKFFTIMIVVTMWLDAGIIPFFLNLRDLGLLDKRITIIIAFACSTFNVILLRTFFENVPRSLEEAAKIDGANDFSVLRKVYLPLSKPALATIGLFYAVTRWNGYFWAMIILKDNSKIPLQVVLKKMIVEMSVSTENMDVGSALGLENLIYATIIVSIVPMMILYPYIQKYFSKGIMMGAVKG
ncbi:carbohydrate ABC transporter permease [Vallitalea sp.]|jgi:putative aldouronate transport system permease protein|uniref:carbohydrate ABC transporter permease n=1 Tax=Vallitalea sp. TaxID=1882829 RepID=UPI0025D93251|nr:carbohydrate ABC transporter permease [Vallitalea sp.]MCT4685797.1 carbohydrate ABC transporter permease [Vallitalea sp.]